MKVPTHSQSVRRILNKLIIPVLLVLALVGVDLLYDIREHDFLEVTAQLLIYGLLVYVAWIGFSFYKLDKKALEKARRNIDSKSHQLASAVEKNQRLQEGVNQSMQTAFSSWKLTPAESAVAALILKGFSLNEIADLRGTSERTTRDQAAAIYRKAKVKNRIELTAYFVEDLL